MHARGVHHKVLKGMRSPQTRSRRMWASYERRRAQQWDIIGGGGIEMTQMGVRASGVWTLLLKFPCPPVRLLACYTTHIIINTHHKMIKGIYR